MLSARVILIAVLLICSSIERAHAERRARAFGQPGGPAMNLVTTIAQVCGDGSIGGAEGCDDNNTTADDGCSAACGVEGGWECSGTPSVCTPLSTTGIALGSTNNFLCGEPNHLEGISRFTIAFKAQSGAAAEW